jgi:hypothetical protein
MTICPATTIVLVVSPSINADGGKAYSTRGQLFDGSVDGRRIVKRSTVPFCDAARALLSDGIKPETTLVMRHASSPSDALRSSVGVASKLAVWDDGLGKPIFGRWKPREALAGTSPMRETDPAATLMPVEPENALEPAS